jgi:hypothetical protein
MKDETGARDPMRKFGKGSASVKRGRGGEGGKDKVADGDELSSHGFEDFLGCESTDEGGDGGERT